MDGFLISGSFAKQIKSTIARVDGLAVAGEVARIPTRFEAAYFGGAQTFRICEFTGTWAINTDKEVTFKGVTSTPNTVSVTNVLYELPDQGTVPCAVAKDGTAWYLVDVRRTTTEVITNVTLGTAGLVFTKVMVQVVSTATASSVTIGTTSCATA